MNKILVLFGCFLLSANSLAADPKSLQLFETRLEVKAEEWITDGIVEAVHQSTVSAQTSGRIIEILFDVDDYVEKGAVLVRFSDREQRASFSRAQAQLKEAQARLEQSESEHNRIQSIYKKKLVAKRALDKAVADLKAARARLAAARAGVKAAQEQLEHTVVRAPYSGIVVKRLVEVGETVRPGTRLLSGLSLEKLRVILELPQRLIGSIDKENGARVRMPDGTEVSVAGKDIVIFPYADTASHTFRIRLKLQVGVKGLYPGMVVKAALVTGEDQQLIIPRAALVHRSEVTAVYRVLKNGKVLMQQVRVGRQHGADRVEIVSGLEPGDRIAMNPIQAGVLLKKQQEKTAHE